MQWSTAAACVWAVVAAVVLGPGSGAAGTSTSSSSSTPSVSCQPAAIPNSNRTAAAPCRGLLGAECAYTCNAGFRAIGRHTCQHYAAGGKVFIDNEFFGGRCQRLCPASAAGCRPGEVPVRYNSTDSDGAPCFATECLASGDEAFRAVLRGVYAVWSLARDNSTGQYQDHVAIPVPDPNPGSPCASGVTGLGLITEATAAALGLQTVEAAASKIEVTLRHVVGEGEAGSFKLERDAHGFVGHFYDCRTGGKTEPSSTSCMMCSGFLGAGALFARQYMLGVAAGSPATQRISDLAERLFESIRYETLLCNANGTVAPQTGTGVPMLHAMVGNGCGATQFPQPDGFYGFNEEHTAVWLAYEQACGRAGSKCNNTGVVDMWARWMGRREHPSDKFGPHELMTAWGTGYILPYYTAASYNSDAAFLELFKSNWLADWLYANETEGLGLRGRYGLGAGPSPQWCSEGNGYLADRINGGSSHCRIVSPYILAGYLPAAPDVISGHLLALLADGDTVLRVPASRGTDSASQFVLWRKAELDLGWQGHITLVDLSSELFGLSTLFLDPAFFPTHTNYTSG